MAGIGPALLAAMSCGGHEKWSFPPGGAGDFRGNADLCGRHDSLKPGMTYGFEKSNCLATQGSSFRPYGVYALSHVSQASQFRIGVPGSYGERFDSLGARSYNFHAERD